MGLGFMLKQTIKRSDLLGAPTILRHKGEPFYESLFGGITTIVLFIAFIIIFILKLYSLITLTNINSSSAYTNNQNDTGTIDNFFFGLTLPFMTYEEMTTIFTIELKVITTGQPDIQVNLVNCTKQMWNSRGIYNEFLYTGYLCPQKTDQLKVSKTATKSSYIRIGIDCADCASSNFSDIQKRVQQQHDLFQADLWMINTILSQGDENPVAVYIDTIPFTTFGTNLGTRALIQLTPYKIDTDVSFLPFTQTKTKTGYYIQDKYATKTLLYSGQYAVFTIQKSRLGWQVQRQYGKFDDLLSYVGGLFGLLFVVFSFFLAPYNQIKYEVMIAEAIFKNESLDNVNKITQQNWNFLTYLKFILYDWMIFFNCPPKKWKQMKQFNQSRTQALFLLDSKYLLKRIRYLQTAVSIMLPKNKQTCLRLIEVPQIQTLRKQRKTMQLFDEYKIEKLKQKKKSKDLAQMLIQQTIQKTIFQFATPSQKFLQVKNEQDRQKWKQECSDSQQIQDDDVKNQIQFALKQMLEKKELDDEYNKIYDLMEQDFKGWVDINPLSKTLKNNRKKQTKSQISSVHESQNQDYFNNYNKKHRNKKNKYLNGNINSHQNSQTSLNKINMDDYEQSGQQFQNKNNKNTNDIKKKEALQNLANVMNGKKKNELSQQKLSALDKLAKEVKKLQQSKKK